jgi:DNA polymerase III delta prime subunit
MNQETLLNKVKSLEETKVELLQKYSSFSKELQEITNEMIRIEGAVREFKSMIGKEEVKQEK